VLLGCSREGGSAVVVDEHGGLTFPAYPRTAERPQLTQYVGSIALSEKWLVLGGGTDRFSGWLVVQEATGGVDARWPLDGMAVGIGVSDDVIVAATPDGLASIRLPAQQ
jgi:hypothetical protein